MRPPRLQLALDKREQRVFQGVKRSLARVAVVTVASETAVASRHKRPTSCGHRDSPGEAQSRGVFLGELSSSTLQHVYTLKLEKLDPSHYARVKLTLGKGRGSTGTVNHLGKYTRSGSQCTGPPDQPTYVASSISCMLVVNNECQKAGESVIMHHRITHRE